MRGSTTLKRSWLVPALSLALAVALGSCQPPSRGEEVEDGVSTSDATGRCGVERWSVKTGTDPDAGGVNLNPQDITIAALVGLPRPARLPANNRVAPYEFQTFRLTNVTLTVYKLENDSDYHIVASDGSRTVITEIPYAGCVGGSSPFLSGIQSARAVFDSRFTPTTSFQTANVTASLIGVGFFDAFHGQTGVAPNGIEIHAVTGLCFGSGCQIGGGGPPPDDFAIQVSPGSQSIVSPGSVAYSVSTQVTSGNPQSINLSVSGLPSGVSGSFSPSSITAGGGSTLTLNVSSGAPIGPFGFTVTGAGAASTQSASASLTVTTMPTGGVVTNGDFETSDLTGWTVTIGSVSAVTTTPHGGSWSAQIGSTGPLMSDSTLVQTINVPATGTNTLSFWYNPHCNDVIQYDWQDAQVQDLAGAVLINLLHVCENTGVWTQVAADLTPYNGTSVNLVFTDHDDGYAADPTYYLLDDVTVTTGAVMGGPPSTSITSPSSGAGVSQIVNVSASAIAQGGASITRIEVYVDGSLIGSGSSSPATVAWDTTTVPNGSHTLTSAAYDSAGFSATSSPVTVTVSNGIPAQDLITNGGFENGLTGWTRGGAKLPIASTAHPHSGGHSLRCGATTGPGTTEPNGDSWAYQTVTLPAAATQATLTFWYYALTYDTVQYDWQDAEIRDSSGATLISIFHMADNSRVWTQRTVDLTSLRGRTIRVYFNAHGDGLTDPTTLWIDDVSLMVR